MNTQKRCMGEKHIHDYKFKIEKGNYCPECRKIHVKAIKKAKKTYTGAYGLPYAIKKLINAKPGTKIYVTCRYVSRSGMLRIVDAHLIDGDSIIQLSILSKDKSFIKYDYERGGFKMGGCGMDMGFALVYDIGRHIHGNGYYFEVQWL